VWGLRMVEPRTDDSHSGCDGAGRERPSCRFGLGQMGGVRELTGGSRL
jgi:hypothetical protein